MTLPCDRDPVRDSRPQEARDTQHVSGDIEAVRLRILLYA